MVPNWPIFKALSALRWAKIAQHGLKMGSFHLFVHLVHLAFCVSLEKNIFDPFLTDFWSQKAPIFKAFGDSGVAKMVCCLPNLLPPP